MNKPDLFQWNELQLEHSRHKFVKNIVMITILHTTEYDFLA